MKGNHMHRSVITILLLLFAAACSSQPAPGGRPVIESFTANPATVAPGDQSTLGR
jgi:hypothetical protein